MSIISTESITDNMFDNIFKSKKGFRSKTICSPSLYTMSEDRCNIFQRCNKLFSNQKRSPIYLSDLNKEESDETFEDSTCSSCASAGLPTPPANSKNEFITPDITYLAPCERRISKNKMEYIINDSIPCRSTTMSKVEFGVRSGAFTPLAFKTVYSLQDAQRELVFLNSVKELPYVVHLIDTFQDDEGHQILVLPILKPLKLTNLDLIDVAKYFKQLLIALDGLHQRNIVHMDITPGNLMIDDNGDLVLIDFGLSTFSDGKILCPSCGTPGYIAPEVFENDSICTTKIDIYSAGIIFGTMLGHYIAGCDLQFLGGSMVRSTTTEAIIEHLKSFLAHFHSPSHNIFLHNNNSTSSLGSGNHYSSNDDVPPIIYMAADCLMNMLQTDPKLRPSAKELLCHPFIHYYDNRENMTSDPFIGTDHASFEDRKRMIAYREHQWNSVEESEDDCYYSYCN